MTDKITGKYDSAFCGSLPIHLINVIQPYGALLIFETDSHNIIQVSSNISSATSTDAALMLNTPLSLYLDHQQLKLLEERTRDNITSKTPFQLRIGDTNYLVVLHNHDKYHILEINFDSKSELQGNSFFDVYQELKPAIAAIERATTIEEAAAITALELKKASGFDKVMVYRFDEEWNGHVLAEERESDMESYQNFTFPASDIPSQARDLYLKNAYRFIPDRNYLPVRLYPVMNPLTQSFIDLSECNIRGVSAVHIEYLKNMNVVASMSTRILESGKLWGLIACHHKTVKPMSYRVCALFELISGIISAKISSLATNQNLIITNKLQDHYTRILEEVFRSGNMVDTFLKAKPNILHLFEAVGAVITLKSEFIKSGRTPEDQDLDDLLLWLNAKQITDVYTTDNLSQHYENATAYKEFASGLMVIPVNAAESEFIILFRPEIIRVNNWGGDPSNRMVFESDMKTYHPRFSFKLWREQVTGISLPWKKEEVELAQNLRSFIRDYAVSAEKSN
ncbi:MAG: GAF domain-containing protein [Chitinophagaceae bacterium]|nr:MAG: GAF domain-containing protein [Chitinophagaceae bacterium]